MGIRSTGAGVALCFAVACGDGDAGAGRPDGGGQSKGGAASASGGSGGGGGISSGGRGESGAAASGGGSSGAGGLSGGVDAGLAGGAGDAVDAGVGGSGGGSGGSPPLPYCNGHSGDLTTDGLNCGKCDNTCQPSAIAYGLNAPGSILADRNHVYWAEHTESGRIFRVALGGTNTNNPPAIASGQKNPRALATDGANLYWLTDNGVMKRPLAGGSATSIAAEPATYWPTDLTLDETSIYWTTHSDVEPFHYATVKKMPLGGGTAVELTALPITGVFGSIAVDATNVYFVHIEYVGSVTSQPQRRIAHLYKVPLAGGDPVEIHQITSYTNILDLAVHGNRLYFTTYERLPGAPTINITKATLKRMPLGGGIVETIGAGITLPVGVAPNDQGVFWAASNATPPIGSAIGGSIRSVPDSLSEPMELSWNSQPTSIAATDTHLYITDWLPNGTSNGKVTRIGLCVASECQ